MTIARAAVLLLIAVVTACAGTLKATGPPDPALERAALENTAPTQPLRIVFDWHMRERDGRFRGQGVARVEPPDRARIDLFGPRGDGLLSAAIVDGDVRLPSAQQTVDLPPPPMMWAVLGVVEPPQSARLISTARKDDRVQLLYLDGGGRLRYDLDRGRLRGVQWDGPGNRRYTVQLEGDSLRLPDKAVYRDWAGYVELVIELKQVQDVDPYPPETWNPAR
ncbi:MAG: hypothetical protein P8099_04520 [Gemmatimonadota bacterium]